MAKNVLTAWQRLLGLLKLDKRDVLQTFYYAIFAGLVNLSLPLGIQAIINLIQSAEISTSWVVLVVLVTGGVAFGGLLQLMQIRIIENVQQKIFTRASFEFTYRFPKIRMSELHNYYPPELANRVFDTLNVQKGFSCSRTSDCFWVDPLVFLSPVFYRLWNIVSVAYLRSLQIYRPKRDGYQS